MQIHLDKSLGPTDRGTLWRGRHEVDGDHIVRTIETRFSDLTFRNLVAGLKKQSYPRMLEVIDEGWLSEQYYVEYRAGKATQTLEEFFQRLHWRQRLAVLMQVCEVIAYWWRGPVHPLGLNERNIVMVETAGRWLPWLVPSPIVEYSCPYDLFGTDARVIATLAPEFIRGVAFNERVQDMYALGTLACFALGCHPLSGTVTDEEWLEAQACSTLLTCVAEVSEIEPLLQHVEAVKNLIRVIHRYRHIEPNVRPTDPTELRVACAAALQATDPEQRATDLLREGRKHEAVQALEWGIKTFGEKPLWRERAAEVYLQLQDWHQALEHLELLIELVPEQDPWLAVPAVVLRVKVRVAMLEELLASSSGTLDEEGEALLADIVWLRQAFEDARAKRALQDGRLLSNLYRQVTKIYLSQDKLAQASEVLLALVELEPSDMEALHLYGKSLCELNKSNEDIQQTVHVAHDRIERMVRNQMMNEKEALLWRKEFDSLLE